MIPEGSTVVARVWRLAERAAAIAGALADATRLVPLPAARSLARLSPLGWYAVAAVNHFDAADPLSDSDFVHRPDEVQTEVWGLDHAAITRRLGRGGGCPRGWETPSPT